MSKPNEPVQLPLFNEFGEPWTPPAESIPDDARKAVLSLGVRLVGDLKDVIRSCGIDPDSIYDDGGLRSYPVPRSEGDPVEAARQHIAGPYTDGAFSVDVMDIPTPSVPEGPFVRYRFTTKGACEPKLPTIEVHRCTLCQTERPFHVFFYVDEEGQKVAHDMVGEHLREKHYDILERHKRGEYPDCFVTEVVYREEETK